MVSLKSEIFLVIRRYTPLVFGTVQLFVNPIIVVNNKFKLGKIHESDMAKTLNMSTQEV